MDTFCVSFVFRAYITLRFAFCRAFLFLPWQQRVWTLRLFYVHGVDRTSLRCCCLTLTLFCGLVRCLLLFCCFGGAGIVDHPIATMLLFCIPRRYMLLPCYTMGHVPSLYIHLLPTYHTYLPPLTYILWFSPILFSSSSSLISISSYCPYSLQCPRHSHSILHYTIHLPVWICCHCTGVHTPFTCVILHL